MTDTQLYLSIGIPTFMVLLRMFLNLSATKELATRVTELTSRFAVFESDMRQFYHLNGKLEGRVDALEKR